MVAGDDDAGMDLLKRANAASRAEEGFIGW